MTLPKLFEERMKELPLSEYNDFHRSFDQPPKSALRINTLKITPEELNKCIRLWPHKIQGEGHFIALLQKTTSENNTSKNDDIRNNVSENKPLKKMTIR